MEPDDPVGRVGAVNLPVTEVDLSSATTRFHLTYDYDFEAFYAEARIPLARALAVTPG